jgi:ABC-type oligopeptide transport system substrate-binding subunit
LKQFFRITAALLAAAFLLALTGCGSSSSAPSFTWFVDTIPANLDPQVASAARNQSGCGSKEAG